MCLSANSNNPITTTQLNSETSELQSGRVTPYSEETILNSHIMISYNRSSSEKSKQICDGLKALGYEVWMDVANLRGNILEAMARAVESSYIVLLCINDGYYNSPYCRKEAEYTAENYIPFIPCMMQENFRCESWLGIIKGSQLHIDFATLPFNDAFQLLINEIKHIESQTPNEIYSRVRPSQYERQDSATLSNFDKIIKDYKKSINKTNKDLKHLRRRELIRLIEKLRELFNMPEDIINDFKRQESTSSITSDDGNNESVIDDDFIDNFSRSIIRNTLSQPNTCLTATLAEQNATLVKIVDRLATNDSSIHLSMESAVKLMIIVMILWT
ncbi:unnamed protein product, partial [Didymodactylos carnosus]